MEPGGGRVEGRWGTRYPQGGQPASVGAVGVDWRKAGFTSADRGWSRVEVVGDRSADLVPEGVPGLGGTVFGDQEVSPVRQNGEKQAHGDTVSQKGACPSSRGGEAFTEGKRGLGESQAVVEVVGGVQGGRQSVA